MKASLQPVLKSLIPRLLGGLAWQAIPCALALAVLAAPLAAQMTSRPVRDGSRPVGADSGPVSEMSTHVGAGGRSVHGDGSVHDGIPGRLGGRSVRESVTGDLRSGAVSDITVGSVATRLPPAVRVVPPPEYFPPTSEGMPYADDPALPVYDLQPLADRLREVQPLRRDTDPAEEELSEDLAQAEDLPLEGEIAQPDEEAPPADEPQAVEEEPAPSGDEEPPAAEDEPAPEEEPVP